MGPKNLTEFQLIRGGAKEIAQILPHLGPESQILRACGLDNGVKRLGILVASLITAEVHKNDDPGWDQQAGACFTR